MGSEKDAKNVKVKPADESKKKPNTPKKRESKSKVKESPDKKKVKEEPKKSTAPVKKEKSDAKVEKLEKKKSKDEIKKGKDKEKKSVKISISKPGEIVDILPAKARPSAQSQAEVKIKTEADKPKSNILKFKPPVVVVKEKPKIIYPPVKTKPWAPKAIKPKPKPEIEYPPLTPPQRPWKSPFVLKSGRPKKLVRKSSKYEKVNHPIPIGNAEKCWNYFKYMNPKFLMLRGDISQTSKRFNFMSNGKQSTFINVIALVYASVCPMKFWSCEDVDEIVNFGDINFRKQMKKFQNRDSIIKPPEIELKIYISRGKISTDIGVRTFKGIFDEENMKEMGNQMMEILKDFKGVIFSYCGQNFAIWMERDAYFLFNSESTDEQGNNVDKYDGTACVLRAMSLDPIVDYIGNYLRFKKKRYELYSFKINEKLDLDDEKEKLMEAGEEIGDATQEAPLNLDDGNALNEALEQAQTEDNTKACFDEILMMKDSLLDFSEHFEKKSDSHGFLKAMIALSSKEKDQLKAPFINSAALIMLRLCRAALWKTATLEEIFKLGETIFTGIKDKTIPITEQNPIVSFCRRTFQITAENCVFGKIQSRANVVTLENGLDHFFRHFDCGFIQGPEIVSIWRENGLYFLFDPHERINYRKPEESEKQCPKNCCLNWFKDVDLLREHYIENLPKKHRKDNFKICKVDVSDYVKKAADWSYFKAISANKWILSGTISEENPRFGDSKSNQATCICVVAIGKTRLFGIQNWRSETVDDILYLGNEFYRACQIELIESEKIVDKKLCLSEIKNYLLYEREMVDFEFEECVVNGSLLPVADENVFDLENGLKDFFEFEETGIVTTCGITVAVWKIRDFYYLFDSHGRDEQGRNIKFVGYANKCDILPGKACVLRFADIAEMTKHLLLVLEFTDNAEYNISKVEAIVQSNERPCLYHYKEFGTENYGAMLRAMHEMHEDHEVFRSKASQKTLCNLLVALGFSKLWHPRFWSPIDVNDILKMGSKLLCEIAKDVEIFDDTPWDMLKNFKLNTLTISVELDREQQGFFYSKKYPLGYVKNQTEVLENEIQMNDISDTESKTTSLAPSPRSSKGSTILDFNDSPTLKSVLLEWEDYDEADAVLIAHIFTIALWKRNKLYYLFDPKPSGKDGCLVRSRLDSFNFVHLMMRRKSGEGRLLKHLENQAKSQRESMAAQVKFATPEQRPSLLNIATELPENASEFENVPEEGGAYVVWFTNVDLLINHILHKVPTKYASELFSLQHLKITKQMDVTTISNQKWFNFEQLHGSHWILRGSIAQGDTQFPEETRNNQDIANSVMALAFSKFCSPSEWDSLVLDMILKYGDRLQKKSFKKLRHIEAKEYSKIPLEKLDFPFLIKRFVITVDHELYKKEQLVGSADDEESINLHVTLEEFFSNEENTAIITSKKYSVAVWKHQEFFYMFDPHDVGPDGLTKPIGVSCLQRFGDLKKLVEIFYGNIENIDGLQMYELHKVMVAKTFFRESVVLQECGDWAKDENVPLESSYSFYRDINMLKVLRGKHAIESELACPVPLYHSVAAIYISQAIRIDHFTRDTVDMIVNFGNTLYRDHKNYCFPDLCMSSECKTTNEFCWSFTMNDVTSFIHLNIFKRGSIVFYLRSALEEILQFYCSGILITKKLILPFWNDSGKFVVFYPNSIEPNGKITTSAGKFYPGICIFADFEKFYENIFQNIGTKDHEEKFELRVCFIKSEDAVELACQDSDEEPLESVKPAVTAIVETMLEKEKPEDEKKEADDEELPPPKPDECRNCGEPVESAVYGSLSKISKKFNVYSKGHHVGPIILTSAAIGSICKLKSWNTKTIDSILNSGYNLYMELSVANNTKEYDVLKLETTLTIGHAQIQVKTVPEMEIDQDGLNKQCWCKCLKTLFANYSVGYINAGLEFLTLFSQKCNYYVFDPLGIKSTKNGKIKYRAAFFNTKTNEKFVEQIMRCLENNPNITKDSKLILGGIKLKKNCDPKKVKSVARKITGKSK